MNKRIKGFMFAAAILASLAGCAKGTDSQSDTAVETAVTTKEITSIYTETVTESTNAIVNDATELPPYKASPGSPYIPIPDLTGYDVTDPFNYQAGKTEITDVSNTQKLVSFFRDGMKIFGVLYLPEGNGPFPTVVLSSGQTAPYSYYSDEAKTFAENGYAAIIYDYIGAVKNSNSDGELTDSSVLTEVQDLNAILDSLSELPKVDTDNVFLWGQSIGGLVSTITAGDRRNDIKGLILLEPDFTYPDSVRYFNPDLSKVTDVIDEPEKYNIIVGKQFIIDMCSVDALKEIEEIDKDVLAVFGNATPDTSSHPSLTSLYPEAYETAIKTFKSCESITVDGADHLFQGKEGKEATEKAVEFINAHVS